MTSWLRHIAPGESGDSLGSAKSFRCPPRWCVSVARTTGCQGVACRAMIIGSQRCSRGWTNGNRQTSTWSIQQDHTHGRDYN
ncbi:hypothetical protein PVAP13_2NG552003 [Panicum virgatum]|uniref:Uncharacterized protein n=1 Tax=Panicum virgatum TaxID=38727 RepID=A0A8T0VW87_PANVG|nr:hypothetical protein PVAP13_2NG552003 [Panicum virgatum]